LHHHRYVAWRDRKRRVPAPKGPINRLLWGGGDGLRSSTFDRTPAGVRDHDKLNLDRLFADSRSIGIQRYESGQHKAGNQLMREPMGDHQGLGNASRNVGKPSQGAALIAGHVIVLV
jgi:hypothetical protein